MPLHRWFHSKNANHMKAGNEIIQYVKNQPSFADFVADNLLRTVIPEKGAWSDWEKTIILARWLPLAGWQVNLKWVTAADIAKDTPVTRGFLLKPILEASIPGSGTLYFDIRQGLSLGNTLPLYGAAGYAALLTENLHPMLFREAAQRIIDFPFAGI